MPTTGRKRVRGKRKPPAPRKARERWAHIRIWLEKAIEIERSRLLRACSLLSCLAYAIEDSRDRLDPSGASDVAHLARELVDEAAGRLDRVSLQRHEGRRSAEGS